MKKQNGITLVALVITIIVLLILAGITIGALSNSGIFTKANEAASTTKTEYNAEKETLNSYETELQKYPQN